VLLVDENPMNVDIMLKVLQDEYDLAFAFCGQQCISSSPARGIRKSVKA
jgi:hypothetical protein